MVETVQAPTETHADVVGWHCNPCPMVLIGLPDTIVTFHEGRAAFAEVEAAQDLAGGDG
jgi:hypothetical protein